MLQHGADDTTRLLEDYINNAVRDWSLITGMGATILRSTEEAVRGCHYGPGT